MKHKKLQERESFKREYEKRINACLDSTDFISDFYARVSFLGIKQPHVVVKVATHLHNCDVATGLGIARCQARDKWNEKEGVERATKKAVRDAARKLAGLDGWL